MIPLSADARKALELLRDGPDRPGSLNFMILQCAKELGVRDRMAILDEILALLKSHGAISAEHNMRVSPTLTDRKEFAEFLLGRDAQNGCLPDEIRRGMP